MSYCVHNVTVAVLPGTKSMEIHCSGHIMYTILIGHSYFQIDKPEITEPTNPIQCRPHDLGLIRVRDNVNRSYFKLLLICLTNILYLEEVVARTIGLFTLVCGWSGVPLAVGPDK